MAKAIELGYPMNSALVRQAFADYLMMLVTDGYESIDNTGTLVGNATHAKMVP